MTPKEFNEIYAYGRGCSIRFHDVPLSKEYQEVYPLSSALADGRICISDHGTVKLDQISLDPKLVEYAALVGIVLPHEIACECKDCVRFEILSNWRQQQM